VRLLVLPIVGWLVIVAAFSRPVVTPQGPESQPADAITTAIEHHEYDLGSVTGTEFLLNEANKNDFFLLGELHGENEIPALLGKLWPEMWKQGYRHIAAEVSPWAAAQLEFVPEGRGPKIVGLWTKEEARSVHAPAKAGDAVIWGCDMEEAQPQMLIAELAALNGDDPTLRRMAALTKSSYSRQMAPELLDVMNKSQGKTDRLVNDVSLRENLLRTLEVESNRLGAGTRMIAQDERELLMKQQFLQHFRHASQEGANSKVLFRFGRNHLHRGYDARGISTLGNFVAEFAVTQGKKAFNVGAFGSGGSASLAGETWDADERADEPTFALLAEKAKYPATLFDLRPLRALLHAIPLEKRSPLQWNLIYWADSYDAVICYKTVTPLRPVN